MAARKTTKKVNKTPNASKNMKKRKVAGKWRWPWQSPTSKEIYEALHKPTKDKKDKTEDEYRKIRAKNTRELMKIRRKRDTNE